MKVKIVFVFKLAPLTNFCKSLKIWNQNEKYIVLNLMSALLIFKHYQKRKFNRNECLVLLYDSLVSFLGENLNVFNSVI